MTMNTIIKLPADCDMHYTSLQFTYREEVC